ncbi:hypothetical protein SO3561_06310 [Streptomyces olivochromogenes]|uniref:Uncharacterized protein n=1 Tax=Streptomyces olivochromogenes TaxID=1963 RepID=A0A250VKM5_STROL|nr:hypothetical protein SO3561_06310 [Streptomyces olivochromogenes]
MKNPFRKRLVVTPEDTLPEVRLITTDETSWEPVDGLESVEVLVERPTIVQVRMGPSGSRTYGKYRVPTDVTDLDAFVTERVNEFFNNRAN